MPADVADLEAHRTALTGYCYRMLGSPFDAEDAVQETLVRAWRALDRYEGRAAFRTWLFSIAPNVCLDLLKGRGRRGVAPRPPPGRPPARGPRRRGAGAGRPVRRRVRAVRHRGPGRAPPRGRDPGHAAPPAVARRARRGAPLVARPPRRLRRRAAGAGGGERPPPRRPVSTP